MSWGLYTTIFVLAFWALGPDPGGGAEGALGFFPETKDSSLREKKKKRGWGGHAQEKEQKHERIDGGRREVRNGRDATFTSSSATYVQPDTSMLSISQDALRPKPEIF